MDEELKDRVEAFNKDLTELLAKHELALGAEPRIHEGKIIAKPVIVDAKKAEASNKTGGSKEKPENAKKKG